MSDERVVRPRLERTGPHRDFANLLSGVGRGAAATPSAAGSAASTAPGSAGTGVGPLPGASAAGTPPGFASDAAQPPGAQFVEQGVRAAYEVIDTYLRQGQRVAQQFGAMSYGPAQLGGNVSDLQARWLRLSTDLMAGWFDLLGFLAEAVAAPGAGRPQNGAASVPPPARSTPPPPVSTSPPPAPAVSVPIIYELLSARPTQVYLEFHAGRETSRLACHGLNRLEPGAAIPVAFRANPGAGGVVLSIRVPEDQPVGLYTGALLDASSGVGVGTLSLQLMD